MAERIKQNPENEATRRRRRARGVTLIEVMLASSIFALMVLSLFEGIAVSARIARENAEYLQADAYAFDLAWKRYNESYAALRNFVTGGASERTLEEDITEEAAPMLFRAGAPAKSYTTIRRLADPSGASAELGLLISVDVRWGEPGKIRQLSSTHTAKVFKGGSEDR